MRCSGRSRSFSHPVADAAGRLTVPPSIIKDVLVKIIRIFDESIRELTRVDDHNYRVVTGDGERIMSDTQLIYFLSSGTTKGILLYTLMVASLKEGFDLLIDEVEHDKSDRD